MAFDSFVLCISRKQLLASEKLKCQVTRIADQNPSASFSKGTGVKVRYKLDLGFQLHIQSTTNSLESTNNAIKNLNDRRSSSQIFAYF